LAIKNKRISKEQTSNKNTAAKRNSTRECNGWLTATNKNVLYVCYTQKKAGSEFTILEYVLCDFMKTELNLNLI
jgi:hypothetical protein